MLEEVREIISEICNVKASTVERDTKLVADLGLNSFELVNLLIAFEEKFDVEIDDDNLPELETVGDIIDYLENI